MLFGIGKSTFLGIDFGTSSIKAVEVAIKEKNPVLTNFAEVPFKAGQKNSEGGYFTSDEIITLSLRALIEKMQPQSREAYVALPAFSGLITLMEMPEMSENELGEAIKFEAHKYIPSTLDDVSLSWDVVKRIEDGKTVKLEILLVAALKKDVEKHGRYIDAAGLSMKVLELETFSLVRALATAKKGVHLIVDIGARTTNLVLVHDGLIKVSRNIDAGGSDLTRSIMESLEITAERAETMKKSDKDLLNTPESALVFPALQAIITEASRILSSYKSKHPEANAESVILAGGSAQMTGLDTYFEKALSVSVARGNPWMNFSGQDLASGQTDNSYAVAIGLALGGIEALHPENKATKKKLSLKEILNKKI